MTLNILTKKNLTIISYILLGLALICSFYLAFQRVNIEKDYDRVEIMHNLTEVQSLANANNLSLNDIWHSYGIEDYRYLVKN